MGIFDIFKPKNGGSGTVPGPTANECSARESASQVDSFSVMVDEALRLRLIQNPNFGKLPQLVPVFDQASRAFHEFVVDRMARAAKSVRPQSGIAVMKLSCMYLFGKGVQAAMMVGAGATQTTPIDFKSDEMLEARIGSSPVLSDEKNRTAAESMQFGLALFAAHQSYMERTIPTRPGTDEAFVRSEMLKTLQGIPRIAIGYAMVKGYHLPVAVGSEADPSEADEREPIDFEGRSLVPDVASLAVTKIVDDEKADRAVYCARIEPKGPAQTAEFKDNSAAAYEIYVITTRGGEVLDINHRVQHCVGARRSFAPHEAPAHIFPPGAMFDLEWEDIAPSARAHFVSLLEKMTVPE